MGNRMKSAPPTKVERSNPEQVEHRNALHHSPSPVGGEVGGAVEHPDSRGGAGTMEMMLEAAHA